MTEKGIVKTNPLRTFWDDSFGGDRLSLSGWMLCLCVFSSCLPLKIYPIFFLLAVCTFFIQSRSRMLSAWNTYLAIYVLYASISFWQLYFNDISMLPNWLKMIVNTLFLYASVQWLSSRSDQKLVKALDYTLQLVLIFSFLQLLYYHKAFNFNLLYGSSSSAQASSLYDVERFFWGLEDKNMFGARLALFGFAFIMLPIARFGKIQLWRIIWVFLLAYMSLSRTPIAALFIGVVALLWVVAQKKYRVILAGLVLASIPFILSKLLRVENITASNDGMGVRLVYWKGFFNHFSEIPLLGQGFMQSDQFLARYAVFYHGEPHIHNTFMTAYLEFGIVGFLSYSLFIIYYCKYCANKVDNYPYWIIAFAVILSIMMILYSGYDNDIMLYLMMIFAIGINLKGKLKDTKVTLY